MFLFELQTHNCVMNYILKGKYLRVFLANGSFVVDFSKYEVNSVRNSFSLLFKIADKLSNRA